MSECQITVAGINAAKRQKHIATGGYEAPDDVPGKKNLRL